MYVMVYQHNSGFCILSRCITGSQDVSALESRAPAQSRLPRVSFPLPRSILHPRTLALRASHSGSHWAASSHSSELAAAPPARRPFNASWAPLALRPRNLGWGAPRRVRGDQGQGGAPRRPRPAEGRACVVPRPRPAPQPRPRPHPLPTSRTPGFCAALGGPRRTRPEAGLRRDARPGRGARWLAGAGALAAARLRDPGRRRGHWRPRAR